MNNETTISAYRPFFLGMTSFTTIVALIMTLMAMKTFAIIHIHCSSFHWMNHIDIMTYSPPLFFL